MAIPSNPLYTLEKTNPREVQGAKRVELALVTFTDESNQQHCTLAVIGEKNVHLLEGRANGFSKNTTPSGPAASWLAQAIFDALEVRDSDKKGRK